MDIGEVIRKHMREVLERAQVTAPTNVAAALNVGRSGRVTAVYSDDRVTIVQRDGETEVIRHHPPGDPPGDER